MSKRIKIADLPEFDAAAYLTSETAIAAYLADIREANDPALLASALEDVARARAKAKPPEGGSHPVSEDRGGISD